jgi:Zn-dependent protease with chaperone function
MTRLAALYPPGPAQAPADLTAPSSGYRSKLLLVLLCLVLFYLVYLGLLVGTLWFLGRCLLSPWNLLGLSWLLRLGLVLSSLSFLVFLVKGLFKRPPRQRDLEVEIFERDHPRLFAFLARLCDEVGADFPRRVLVSPEVNAAAVREISFWRLFWPSPCDLLLGLGLVNVLTLSEFKAVLAHELGHFSQRSSGWVDGYVYTVRKLILSLLEGEDCLDRLLWRGCQLLRKPAPTALDVCLWLLAWSVYGPLWLWSKVLYGLAYWLVFFHQALSREMEFHADLVAVRLSGSDALVHALYRLRFAEEALAQACEDLRVAADHSLYTSDLFYHQSQAAAYLRRLRQKPDLGIPPPLSSDPQRPNRIFRAADEETPSMWADHPTNYEREQNAKRRYLRAPLDDRPAWILFDKAEELRQRLTWQFYRQVLRVPRNAAQLLAADVQAFIDAEHAETTYHPRYHGLYDDRCLYLEEIESLLAEVRHRPWGVPRLLRAHQLLYGPELASWVPAYHRRREEYRRLRDLVDGLERPESGEFCFRGQWYKVRQARRLLRGVAEELKADISWLENLDRKVFLIYYQSALEAQRPAEAEELAQRYRFHLELQQIYWELSGPSANVEGLLQFLSRNAQLTEDEFLVMRDLLRQAHAALARALERAAKLTLPALLNFQAGESLHAFLLTRPLVRPLKPRAQRITGKWLRQLMQQLEEVHSKTRRLYFKSLGQILALQERIAAAFLARHGAGAASPPADPSPAKGTD